MEPGPFQLESPPNVAGRFAWAGLLVTIVAAPVLGAVGAWVGEVGQSYYAPVVLFPVLLGLFVGLSVIGLLRLARIGHRPTAVFGGLLAATVAAVGQHYVAYCLAYHAAPTLRDGAFAGQDLSSLAWQMAPSFGDFMSAQAARGRPLPYGYVAEGWAAWFTWLIDAMLLVAAAIVVMLPALRVPYCNRCHTWYRTVRSGKIDLPTALRLAELLGVEEMDDPHSPRFRLSACQSGCGPMRCEVSWEERPGPGAVALVRIWLTAAGRNEVAAILDSAEVPASESDE